MVTSNFTPLPFPLRTFGVRNTLILNLHLTGLSSNFAQAVAVSNCE